LPIIGMKVQVMQIDEIQAFQSEAEAWAVAITRLYRERRTRGSVSGLQRQISDALMIVVMFDDPPHDWADRINRAITGWERNASRLPGPRIAMFDPDQGRITLH
jgi:hypothetical protein